MSFFSVCAGRERGATVPWIRYESEAGAYTGELLESSREMHTVAAEASQRSAVKLTNQGHYVSCKAQKKANALVVRYCIPDAPQGGGIEATISLYVDNVFRQKIELSSKRSWLYGKSSGVLDLVNTPGDTARLFFAESHALLCDITKGAEVKLQVDEGDTAAYYIIDFVELEQVVPPKAKPLNAYSIVDYGAVSGDDKDDAPALKAAIKAAGSKGTVYIPEGDFTLRSKVTVSGQTIQGAGMWYSRFYCPDDVENKGKAPGNFGFKMSVDNSAFYDIALFSNGVKRETGGKTFSGNARKNTKIGRVWVEFAECAYWVDGGDQLLIFDCRFRNTFADAVNLCAGTTNSVIENCTARNTGDDAFAIWSATYRKKSEPCENNVIRNCTVQGTWRAAAYAVYGGRNNLIENCVAYDTLNYPALTLSTEFKPIGFSGKTVIRNCDFIRCGGKFWGNQEFAAVWLLAADAPFAGIELEGINIVAPMYSGIKLQKRNYDMGTIRFSDITISETDRPGIIIDSGLKGRAVIKNITVNGAEQFINHSKHFVVIED